MLIDFTVANYRSIKEPVTLSAIAQGRSSTNRTSKERRQYVKPDNEIALPYEIQGRGFALLPVLGIFGPNASGKSNVIKAFTDCLYTIVEGMVKGTGSISSFMPFRLDTSSEGQPTSFQLRIVNEQTIYIYELEFNQTRIVHERLEYAPPPPKQFRLLYERQWNESKRHFDWKNGPAFEGSHTQLESSLQENEPFIHLLLSRLEIDVLKPFKSELAGYALSGGLLSKRLFEEVARNHHIILWSDSQPDHQAKVVEILRQFDTGLSDIEIKPTDPDDHADIASYRIIATHDLKEKQVRWPLEEESAGTQRLFDLAAYVLFALDRGGLMLEDELEKSLHPQITRAIIRIFQNPKLNPKCAQLIFTSHDYTLMSHQLLRRDQIWFTQKRQDGSTELYSLSDFRPRNDLAIDRAYLDGRYGAVPILPPDEDLLPAEPVAESAA